MGPDFNFPLELALIGVIPLSCPIHILSVQELYNSGWLSVCYSKVGTVDGAGCLTC